MIVYRLTKAKYKDQLSGLGAQLYGGRWNSKGISVIYTGESRALCTTEIAVHTPLGIVPKDYFLQSIEIPMCEVLTIEYQQLPEHWNNYPHTMDTKSYGDQFVIENEYLVLKVPSAVIEDEHNYLINPQHSLSAKVKLLDCKAFMFDSRLFIK